MQRHLPPTAGLLAFEACARHLSVTLAAAELGLTQSAVSRQLAGLETLLGVRLFHRVRQRLVLTPAGAAYAAQLRPALARITSATSEIRAHRGAGGTLDLAVSPTFGARWLMPRMPRFHAAYRRVMVNFRNVSTRAGPFDFATEDVDAAILLGSGDTSGLVTHHLLEDARVPVCAPELVRDGRLREPAQLARLPLLQQTTRPRGWVEWLDAAGVRDVQGLRGPQFQNMAMVAEAAAAGLGVALLPRFLVAQDIASGRLVIPFDRPLTSGEAYILAYPEHASTLPALRAFRDWLLGQTSRPE